jgi:ADP-heptose:LPS heptosyltransferase
VPARAPDPRHAGAIAAALRAAGWPVVLTGGPGERPLTAQVARAADGVADLAGRTSLAELAAVLAGAACVVVGNTGPAHLAAAVGTPVVSLFSPVVPAERWAPYGVAVALLGDQAAPCRGTRARECPVPGHPCLTGVAPARVVEAVSALAPDPAGVPA